MYNNVQYLYCYNLTKLRGHFTPLKISIRTVDETSTKLSVTV